MTFVLIHAGELEGKIAALLKKELKRFDVRAEFRDGRSFKKTNHGQQDAVIFISGDHSKPNLEVPLFIVEIRTKKSRPVKTSLLSRRTIYSSFPLTEKEQSERLVYFGCVLFDVFKNLDHSLQENSEGEIQIPVVTGYDNLSGRAIRKLKSKLQSKHPQISFPLINLKKESDSVGKILVNSNAAVVTSWIAELAALHFNVPYVFYEKKGLLSKSSNPLQNELLKREAVKIGSQGINSLSVEIDKILSDYQYTAGMLQSFQETKEILGNQPSIRNIAKDIVERLED